MSQAELVWSGILALVVGAFWLLFRNRIGRVRGGPACIKCGYPRAGLDTDHCPECGEAWGPDSRRFVSSNFDLFLFLAALFLPVILATLLIIAL